MTCAHDWIEITTASEAAAGLRRFVCVCDGCDAEKTDPPTN
jgi:hypothetical protein